MKQMVHGSLFSGIGGFDLAAEWAGWKNAFHCEWNEFGQKILRYYWPNAVTYGDITKTDFTLWRGRIDVLTGGFPCQPYSVAGKRKGKEDERHMWPEMLRAIREIAPRYVVGENVYGLVNWNGGLVFDEVQTDLETEGYEVQPVILPACSVNAPHKRERVWFVAYNSNARIENMQQQWENRVFKTGTITNPNSSPTRNEIQPGRNLLTSQIITDTKSEQSKRFELEQREFSQQKQRELRGIDSEICNKWNATDTRCSERKNRIYGKESGRETTKFGDSYTKFGQFSKFPITEPTICSGDDGLSGRLDGITFPKWRNESIKAFGNAIVPQVAYEIFKVINLHNNQQV